MPTSAQRTRDRKLAKIGRIFFPVRYGEDARDETKFGPATRKQAEKRAFSMHGRDAVGLTAEFMRISRIRWRKAAWHGRLRVRSAQDRGSSDGERDAVGARALNLRRKTHRRFWKV
jgi:hypothetical protein